MYRKIIAVSSILLIIGGSGFVWVSNEQKKEKQLLRKQQQSLVILQQQTLSSAVDKLDDMMEEQRRSLLFANNIPSPEDTFLTENEQRQLERCQNLKEARELAGYVSVIFMVIGSMFFVCWPLLWAVRFIFSKFSRSGKELSNEIESDDIAEETQVQSDSDEDGASLGPKGLSNNQTASKVQPSVVEVLGLQKYGNGYMARHRQADFKAGDAGEKKSRPTPPALPEERSPALYCDEKSVKPEKRLNAEKPNSVEKPFDQLAKNIQENILSDYRENNEKLEDSIKAQTENLEKQVAEFKEVAQSVKEASLENSSPLNSTIEELAQQVSAIRQYAWGQQDKIEKLQEGYDWNIIRTFCLRVIRCIDNLENRIKKLASKDIDTTDLEQIRDELIFALESSGVEQFEPQTHSEYKGQEKSAEVIKEKEPVEVSDMEGKISEVVRPGYQYVIDEDNIKIVRPARVKLFARVKQLN